MIEKCELSGINSSVGTVVEFISVTGGIHRGKHETQTDRHI